MLNTMSYYITNEIKVRVKTSLLLWCYVGCVFPIIILNMLVTPFFNQIELYHPLLIMLFFLPLNLDIFSRESQLNMLDHLVMSSTRFNTIYVSRIIANALLMIIPITIGSLSIFIGQFFSTNFSDVFISTPLFLGYLLIISLFFLSWFLIATIILSIIELKYSDSTFRVILYYFVLIIMIGSLILLNRLLNDSSIIIGILLGQQLFENLFLSFIEIIISCVVAQLFLSLVITRSTELVERKMDQEMQSEFGFYALLEAERSIIYSSSWRRMVPYFGIIPYLLIFLILPETPRITVFKESFMVVLGLYFCFILLYVLLIVFPRITIEKEFHMEELLLSRITINQYFFEKVTLLLRSIFFPFIVATMVLTILYWPALLHSNLVSIFPILIIRAFYFVSVIIFFWRLIPSKNLVQTTLFSIIGLEVLGFLVIRSIIPLDPVLLIYSPIISSLLISQIRIDLNDWNYNNPIFVFVWMNFFITIVLFVGSLIVIKSEVRFE